MTAQMIESMPSSIAEVFEELHQDVCQIYLEWNLYREVFGESEDRIALLNRTAKTLFGSLQRMLQDSVYLGLTRMTDPARNRHHDNLTLRQLCERALGQDPSFLASVEKAVANAERICLPFRDHRNKRIAHSDMPSAMKRTFVRPSRQSVEEALGSIAAVMNIFHFQYGSSEFLYKATIFAGGGDALDCYLRAGEHLYELKRNVAMGKLMGDALAQDIISYH
jgi:AbiU2